MTTSRPDLRRSVGVCMTCHHWQVDVRPSAISDMGGWNAAMWAIGEAHLEHLSECPGAGGRINFAGRWVDAPKMSGGKPAEGTIGMHPTPAWWVAR